MSEIVQPDITRLKNGEVNLGVGHQPLVPRCGGYGGMVIVPAVRQRLGDLQLTERPRSWLLHSTVA
jgi:hypothetical protein